MACTRALSLVGEPTAPLGMLFVASEHVLPDVIAMHSCLSTLLRHGVHGGGKQIAERYHLCIRAAAAAVVSLDVAKALQPRLCTTGSDLPALLLSRPKIARTSIRKAAAEGLE